MCLLCNVRIGKSGSVVLFSKVFLHSYSAEHFGNITESGSQVVLETAMHSSSEVITKALAPFLGKIVEGGIHSTSGVDFGGKVRNTTKRFLQPIKE